jgi:hypothetical protein
MPNESSGTERSDEAGSGAAPKVVQVELEPLQTVPLSSIHRTADFRCDKSERIERFFERECSKLLAHNYCRVFILPSPADPTEILGYYTLSPSLFHRDNMSSRAEREQAPGPFPAPAMLIGYMGKRTGAPTGLGKSLILDAARRVYGNPDIAAWGLMLECENGPENKKLWDWYQSVGFKAARLAKENPNPRLMYAAPLQNLIPELVSPKS